MMSATALASRLLARTNIVEKADAGLTSDPVRRSDVQVLAISPSSIAISTSHALAKQLPQKPLKPSKPKKAAGKSFVARFPERKSPAVKILAANVRRLRKMRGFSQKELADAINAEQATISLIELRRSNPTLHMIDQIAAALAVSVGELLTPSPNKQTSD